ncbi:uncharacterized protein EKO05_0002709 [Ascochyta rabiei]|uniref:Sequence-specific DNA binding n=1 Tax=Didymella rabiei TaxID=5454 RepID=A0A163GMF7_DIDRA|nr:uncharacterized protein EKO05_0002709 [Ascochyta rabiei]KZM24921.1 sequence-specific DNA binding [Ascochyta rabiei]UPX12142.1 hypothetical protein EKO05_0002709 [Ascochyta rabiei]
MPLSHSPRLLPAAEISRDLRLQQGQKDIFNTNLPFRTQACPFPSPSSPQLCDKTMSTASRAIVPLDNHHKQQAPMALDYESMPWSDPRRFQHSSLIQDPSAFCLPTRFLPDPDYVGCSSQSQNGLSHSTNYGFIYPAHYPSPSYPRTYNDRDLSGLPSDTTTSYPPASFFHSPPQAHDTLSLPDADTQELMQLNDDYDFYYATHIKHEDQLDYNSPYSDMSRASTPYSTDEQPVDREQPYAQLIYRALHDAPDHTMVLRDIYDWFRRYTDKAAQSETKGWQNSIRHNLSMNGAFEKVESPSDSASKGFMWRLTPSALREGVKSTTRYRSKANNKRSSRTQPQPQRQASGSKGGQAARRAANLRRSQRTRDQNPRSDPYAGSWEAENAYDPLAPSAESPYPLSGDGTSDDTNPFAPYLLSHEPFRPMLGLASHLHSPPRSYTGTPLGYPPAPVTPLGGDTAYALEQAPGELLFSASPTPSGDGPVTPPQPHGVWVEDVAMGVDVFDEQAYHGGA